MDDELKNNPQENKQGRPYLGIVIVANGREYCIPFCRRFASNYLQ